MPRPRPKYTLVANSATHKAQRVSVRVSDSSMWKRSAAMAASIGVANPSDVPVPPIKAMMNSKSTTRPHGRCGKSRPMTPTSAQDKRR